MEGAGSTEAATDVEVHLDRVNSYRLAWRGCCCLPVQQPGCGASETWPAWGGKISSRGSGMLSPGLTETPQSRYATSSHVHAGYSYLSTPPPPTSLYLLRPFLRQRRRAGACRGGTGLAELRLYEGAPFKATGRAGPGGLAIGPPTLHCHL